MQGGHHDVAVVVVVHRPPGEPGVGRGEVVGPIDPVQEGVVHEALAVGVDVGVQGDDQEEAGEGGEEEDLQAEEETAVGPEKGEESPARLRQVKKAEARATRTAPSPTEAGPKGINSEGGEEPGDVGDEDERDHLGDGPAPVPGAVPPP